MPDELGLVLGASGGIGGACAARLGPRMRRLIAVDRERPAEELLQRDGTDWVAADVTQAAGRDAVVDRIAAAGLPLRAVVLASGVAHRGGLADATGADWSRVLDANLVSPALLLSALAARATWSTDAAVVMIGSLSARRALPSRSLYGASKAALEQFARCAAVELAARGIRVNVVSAGVVDTPFLGGDTERLERFASERVPIGRFGHADEVADVVASAVWGPGLLTGAVIDLDGGAGVLG